VVAGANCAPPKLNDTKTNPSTNRGQAKTRAKNLAPLDPVLHKLKRSKLRPENHLRVRKKSRAATKKTVPGHRQTKKCPQAARRKRQTRRKYQSGCTTTTSRQAKKRKGKKHGDTRKAFRNTLTGKTEQPHMQATRIIRNQGTLRGETPRRSIKKKKTTHGRPNTEKEKKVGEKGPDSRKHKRRMHRRKRKPREWAPRTKAEVPD